MSKLDDRRADNVDAGLRYNNFNRIVRRFETEDESGETSCRNCRNGFAYETTRKRGECKRILSPSPSTLSRV